MLIATVFFFFLVIIILMSEIVGIILWYLMKVEYDFSIDND